MTIDFIKDGVRIDERDWHSANPRHDRIEVFFDKSVRVVLTEDFLRRALDLIEHCRKPRVW